MKRTVYATLLEVIMKHGFCETSFGIELYHLLHSFTLPSAVFSCEYWIIILILMR